MSAPALLMTMLATWPMLSALIESVPLPGSPGVMPAALIEMTSVERRICIQETGTSEESIERFNAQPDVFADDDEKLKCYMDCMFRRLNVTKPDGELDMIELYHLIPKALKTPVLKMYNRCRDVVDGSTPCERAYSHHKCWKQAEPGSYYLF
ncbi:general odorant-binding protein 83a-like [Uranotaenia lowii]|uniref:general odorant-binding protein 83a-like n=1 Tax=Uranotaenia lowii TaxID=190385 RepID=UPI002478DCD5|nr:general odorant-binding protein 83a-like [Uranotaenia lowii]